MANNFYVMQKGLAQKNNFTAPFYGWGSTASRLQSYFEEAVYFLPPSSQEVLVLI